MMRPAALLAFVLTAFTLGAPVAAVAAAPSPAATFVSGNIQTGLAILNDKQLSPADRKAQFETFLLGITDMKRIAMFTLGPYATAAGQADKDAFAHAFQDYAVAVYQSYFAKYAGQTLTVVSSNARAPDDFIVVTNLRDPDGRAMEVDFRVRTDAAKPVVVDFSIAGIWLALAERDDFNATLAKNGGSIPALTAHLHDVTGQY